MKLKSTVFILLFFIASIVFPQSIVNQVKIDTLKQYLQELTGFSSCTIDGSAYTITSRNTLYTTMTSLAIKYIKYRLQSYGLTVTEQTFIYTENSKNYKIKNIYAVQKGSQYPDKKFIVCAHYDSMPSAELSPGADDNGSGACAVLEAARIISKYNPKYTVEYVLFGAEEQYLVGSRYFVQQAYQNNDDIVGVLNLDMIGWDKDGDNCMELYYQTPSGKETLMSELLNSLTAVNQNYNIGLTLVQMNTASVSSDHTAFYEYGYPAVLAIEEISDFNEGYHTAQDNFSNIYMDFYEKCSKLAITALAEISVVESPVSIEENKQIPSEFALYQNYPNPFNPSTVISYNIKTAGHVRLAVFDLLGREIKTLVDQYQPEGRQQVTFSVEDKGITSGIYLYRLQTENLSQIKKMVYMK